MLESIKELNKQIVELEDKIEMAEEHNCECITLTIKEANSLVRAVDEALDDLID